MIVDGCKELHEEYNRHLESQKGGSLTMLQWCADRANGAWYQTICKTLTGMLGSNTVCRLKLTKPSESHVFDRQQPIFAHEIELIKEWSTLALSLCINRVWSQCHFGLVLPYCLVRIAASEEDQRRVARTLLRNLANGIFKLEEAAKTADSKSPLVKLLTDLGTIEWVITREILAQGTAVDWDPSDKELRLIEFSLNAGPTTTKNCLENVLSSVKDAASRQAKNTRHMSLYTKWLYAATSKYPNAGDVQQLQVDLDDLKAVATRVCDAGDVVASNCWHKQPGGR